MSKTLVTAKHEPGPAINGHGGCHARAGNDGICPGTVTATWLNSLGNDDDVYVSIHGRIITVGTVRANWLRDNDHLVAVEPERARLQATRQRLHAELRQVEKSLKALGPVDVGFNADNHVSIDEPLLTGDKS